VRVTSRVRVRVRVRIRVRVRVRVRVRLYQSHSVEYLKGCFFELGPRKIVVESMMLVFVSLFQYIYTRGILNCVQLNIFTLGGFSTVFNFLLRILMLISAIIVILTITLISIAID
jgi:hypothetical protein